MRTTVFVLAAAIGLLGGGTATAEFTSPPAPAADGKIVAVWSQIVGPAGQGDGAPAIELRFVVQGANGGGCDAFDIAYEAPAGNGIAGHATLRANPDTAHFPVTVCATRMDADWTAARILAAGGAADTPALKIWDAAGPTGADAAVPGPHALGRRHTAADGGPALHLVTLGDSGCRGAPRQDCADDWALAQIAAAALALAPDLVVHVGDYRYFEEGTSPDTWAYWLQDFLAPARPLLAGAPWALARGNHEMCDAGWYGVGYTFLFGPGAGDACDPQSMPTWHFDVAPAGAAALRHRFVMIDNANHKAANLEEVFAAGLAVSTPDSTWWITHIPPVNLLRYQDDGETVTNVGDPLIAAALDSAIKAHGAPLCHEASPVAPRCQPSALVMGHEHLFQIIDFAESTDAAIVTDTEAWPQVVIVGHGGVAPDAAGLSGGSPCSYGFVLPGTDGASVNGIVRSRGENGFVLWTRSASTRGEPSGWRMSPRGADGSVWTLAGGPGDACLAAPAQ